MALVLISVSAKISVEKANYVKNYKPIQNITSPRCNNIFYSKSFLYYKTKVLQTKKNPCFMDFFLVLSNWNN